MWTPAVVTVDFKPEQEVIAQFKSSALLDAPAGLLEAYYLRMPVIFRVDDVDLIPTGEEYRMPLLFIARIATDLVRGLGDGDSARMLFPMGGGGVVFHRTRDRVSLGPVYSDDRVETDFVTLLAAFEDCSNRIRTYLLGVLPEIADNPAFSAWFEGETR